MSDDRQRQEWEAHEIAQLRKRLCPHSGERLSRNGEAGPDALSCPNCDCFGFDPDDKRIGDETPPGILAW